MSIQVITPEDSPINVEIGGLVGGAVTTATILDKLQGAEADANRIGAEYLPLNLDLDYLVLGEAAGETLPLGGISRLGNRLALHDGVKAGGNVLKDRMRFVGSKIILPYGTTVSGVASTVKRAGFVYWDEVGRITLPFNEIQNGRLLHTQAWTRVISNEAMALGERSMLLVPTSVWDRADYFGATPVVSSPISQTLTPLYNLWRPIKTNSLDSTGLLSRVNAMAYSSGLFSIASSTQFAFAGFDKTANDAAVTAIAAAADLTALKTALASMAGASFTISDTGSLSGITHAVDTDLEFVIVSITTPTETRTVYADISITPL